MRKFIVRNFALSYLIKLYGEKFLPIPRGSLWIVPSLCGAAIASELNLDYLMLFFLSIFAISAFLGFKYFKIGESIKWEELDDVQKVIYMQIPGVSLTDDQELEGNFLFKKEVTSSRWTGLIQLISIILTIIIYTQ